jgi:O-methyltransferase involved in polyketide biosynthesis
MDSLEGKLEGKEGSYERISPTAWGVAYRRTFTDIPYSAEIFEELQEIMKRTKSAAELEQLDSLKYPEMTPMFEARYKLVNRLLKENNAKQILEIAAGFSQRGIEMAKDPSVEYAEVDLPGVIAEKRGIIEKLVTCKKIPEESNLHINEGSALDMNDLSNAAESFRKEPIAVVNEGLLRYLNFNEKTVVARNVHELLERFGGVWITPDITLRDGVFDQSNEKMKAQNARVQKLVGVDFSKNVFDDEDAARKFFEDLGFSIERHAFTEMTNELVSPKKLNLSSEQVEKTLGRWVVFVMRLTK